MAYKYCYILLMAFIAFGCGDASRPVEREHEEEEDEDEVATENLIRFESGDFDPGKPTIVFFGGGNCVNSWDGTESWDNKETNGSAWFEFANVLSFHGYRKDKINGDTTYVDAARMVVDTLMAIDENYNLDLQACGFSTGGTPALDLALFVNDPLKNLPFQVTNVTLMDSPCYDYVARFEALNSLTSPPLIVNLIGGLFNEHRQPYVGVLNADIADGHDDVFWWYVNSLTAEDGNTFNNGLTAGAYLSVIGEGKNIRLTHNKDQVEYYFNWDEKTALYSFYEEEKYPRKLNPAN